MANTKPQTTSNGDDEDTLTPEEKIWYQIVFGKDWDEEQAAEKSKGEKG